MMSNAKYRNVKPERLLERLGIRFTEKGGVLWACCPHPEHNDRTPSWRMIADPDNERFTQHRCYGCGWGGWPVHLVESMLDCSRSEAIEWLRDIEQNPPVPLSVSVDFQRGPVAKFRMPPGVKFAPFSEWPDRPKAYLTERGIPDWQIARWGIGYADGKYDEEKNPLAGRVVIPVYTNLGRLIGYTGRSYVGSKRRYKEPAKSEGADLGAIFGEQYWPSERRGIIVTEGGFDALAVERVVGEIPIGGIYGSQLMPGHISRLSTFPFVLMATDPDKAGNRVAVELEAELRRWVRVGRVELPPGEDAASLALSAPDVLRDAVRLTLNVLRLDGYRCNVEERPRTRRRRTETRVAVESR